MGEKWVGVALGVLGSAAVALVVWLVTGEAEPGAPQAGGEVAPAGASSASSAGQRAREPVGAGGVRWQRPAAAAPAQPVVRADGGAAATAGPLAPGEELQGGMTRREYKRRKALTAEPRNLSAEFNEAKTDQQWTKLMAPKLSAFFEKNFEGVRIQKVECRGESCVVQFHSTESDGVIGMVEQAQQDLGATGGAALGGARVKGEQGLYKYEAMLTFDRG